MDIFLLFLMAFTILFVFSFVYFHYAFLFSYNIFLILFEHKITSLNITLFLSKHT